MELDWDSERSWCSHVNVGTGPKKRPAWERAGRRVGPGEGVGREDVVDWLVGFFGYCGSTV